MKFTSFQVKGDGIGAKKVVPTINLQIPEGFSIEHGVYAAFTYISDVKYKSALHFGPKPTFNKTVETLEIHLLEPEITAKGHKLDLIMVEIVKRIRPVIAFNNPHDLKKQIIFDIKKIMAALDGNDK